MPLALVVEDERPALSALADLVDRSGFTVRTATSLAEARAEIATSTPDVVVADIVLPDGHGTELLADLETDPAEVILVTARASVESAIEALRRGAYDYLTKPVDVDRLKAILARLRESVEMRAEVGRLRRQMLDLGRFDELVGTSDAMRRVYDLIERVAPTEVTVLLTGESGTGKELVAQTIHRLSGRGNETFIPINCGAVSPQLIESELFGHERGAFTGATDMHRGVFERAHRGTLLLDEITEMSPELQVKLLRVLESNRVTRVGGSRELEVDVRVLAASNRDPEEAVEEGRLREDLYYRLKVFPVGLPPLREREGDIRLLAEHFLADSCRELGRTVRLSPIALERLERHTWPGNVRELRNEIERAAILADETITPDLLTGLDGAVAGPRSVLSIPPGMPIDEVVRHHTLTSLEHFGGNKRRTARELGISIKTLYNRLARYEQEPG
jgi:DNA-binding NtrC family response regulator